MAGFQADAFQWASLIYVRPLAGRKTVAKKTWVTSFLIFRTKCLWDAVGHFLGFPTLSLDAVSAGLRARLSLVKTRAVVTHAK
jgi:hypothetical protein